MADPVVGVQTPRIETVPPYVSSTGAEAVELAAMAGLRLDPWQRYVLERGLGEDAAGDWSAFEVCVNVPRQNGKGAVIEALELAWLFLLGEELIVHTAHQVRTAKVAFKRIVRLIRGCPELHEQVKQYRYVNGEESIELHTGQMLQFMARSAQAGRGFTGNKVVLDEAMYLGDEPMDALTPTLSTVLNPQLWYLGSAGIGERSVQLARLRRRALAAVAAGVPDSSLAYFEWSIDWHADECPTDCTAHDDPEAVASWARANPGFGIRITPQFLANERTTMGVTGFSREVLGVGDYPEDAEDQWTVIPEAKWRGLAFAKSTAADPVAMAIDTTPERSWSSIGIAGAAGEQVHVEVIDQRPGTGWVVDRAAELQEKWKPCAWAVQAGTPAASLIPALEKRGLEITVLTSADAAKATGQFIDSVNDHTTVHKDQAPLATALAGAVLRTMGDASVWARRGVQVDITPLTSVTLARYASETREVVEKYDVLASIY